MTLAAVFLALILYVTGTQLIGMLVPGLPFPQAPARWVSVISRGRQLRAFRSDDARALRN